MNPAQIERVFGRGRLKMTTGEHVEVFREAVAPGERRRYTKRFLATSDGDFGQWTEREWRILARLIGHGIHCVPDVVQFDAGALGGIRLVQTYDAGVTVDQWATLLPVSRDGAVRRHVFEDCAHWWALAHYCLTALDEIHSLELVHLDIKGDNICVPYGPTELRSRCGRPAVPDFPEARIDRFRVFAGVSARTFPRHCRSVGRKITITSRPDCSKRSMPGATAICSRRRSSTGAAICTASPQCSSVTCRARRRATTRHGHESVTTTRGHSSSGCASVTIGTCHTGDRISS